MNRVYFDVDFLMQPSRFAGATVFFNTIGETAGKASIKILGAPHSRRCFLKNVCFSVQNPVEMGIIFSKSMLKSARLIFCIVIRRNLPGTFYADSTKLHGFLIFIKKSLGSGAKKKQPAAQNFAQIHMNLVHTF